MISPLAAPLVSSIAAMLVLPVGFITGGEPDVPANALRDEDGVPYRDENGNYILDT